MGRKNSPLQNFDVRNPLSVSYCGLVLSHDLTWRLRLEPWEEWFTNGQTIRMDWDFTFWSTCMERWSMECSTRDAFKEMLVPAIIYSFQDQFMSMRTFPTPQAMRGTDQFRASSQNTHEMLSFGRAADSRSSAIRRLKASWSATLSHITSWWSTYWSFGGDGILHRQITLRRGPDTFVWALMLKRIGHSRKSMVSTTHAGQASHCWWLHKGFVGRCIHELCGQARA